MSRGHTALEFYGNPIVIVGAGQLSKGELTAVLGSPLRLAWVVFSPQDEGDQIAQGNKLTDALNDVLQERLLGYGLPYRYALRVLDDQLGRLAPFAFVALNAEYAPELTRDLLSLKSQGQRLLLEFGRLPKDLRLPEGASVLSADELKREWASAPFGSAPMKPPVAGASAPPGLTHAERLGWLIREGQWTEALAFASKHEPGAVPEVLAEAGHIFHERGLHRRLLALLEQLPDDLVQDEQVLYWRLTAASRINRRAELMRAEVESHLAVHEAPDLRALYAGVLAPPSQLEREAERAFQAKATPLTAFQYGRSLVEQLPKSLDVLSDSVVLAERVGRSYDVARNAGLYASRLIFAGRYRDAAHWAAWALRHFDRSGLGDQQRRLMLVNELAYARLLIGETLALREELEATAAHLHGVLPALARLFRSTLGDYLLVRGSPENALSIYQENLEASHRSQLGKAVLGVVRTLLELGRSPEALKQAERVLALTEREHPAFSQPAILAYGMALSEVSPPKGAAVLHDYLEAQTSRAHYQGQASLHLARALLQLGRSGEARQTLTLGRRGLAELSLSGFHLFAGPEGAYREVLRLYQGSGERLELKFLGRREAWLDDRPLELTPRECDLLALLVLNPAGLGLEALMIQLSGDDGNRRSLTSGLTKLRGKVPISWQPYRLEVPVKADFITLRTHIEEGALRKAFELYQGPLLPESEAPGVEEVREALQEALRQAVLNSADAEVAFALAQRLEGDLELWEHALSTLPQGDPRRPVVRAQAEMLRRSWR